MARKSKSAPAAEAVSASPPLQLPAELTIYTAGELHPQWVGWLHASAEDDSCAVVQGQAVEQVDAAGIQMLLALSASVAARGRPLLLKAPSDALRTGCDALGLGSWLQTLSVPAAPAAGAAS